MKTPDCNVLETSDFYRKWVLKIKSLGALYHLSSQRFNIAACSI